MKKKKRVGKVLREAQVSHSVSVASPIRIMTFIHLGRETTWSKVSCLRKKNDGRDKTNDRSNALLNYYTTEPPELSNVNGSFCEGIWK